ncbi:MAG: zinc ribbon domain-containing protein [Balneolaceae bacterium]|nr:MAG: zinc ribbon domain-containing protein [Balneolaceae bacterium]
MPTYEYKREDGTMFEIVQKISDEALITCPETGQKVKRVISGGGGVVYKGSGWYVTDYKNRSANGAGGTDGKTSGNGKASAAGTESAAGSTSSKASTEGKANGNGAAAGTSEPASSSPSRKSGS